MKNAKTLALAAFFVLALFIVYVQFFSVPEASGGFVGKVTASPAESATTITGLVIVFFLVWFSFKEE